MSDQGFSGNPSTPFLTTFSQGAQFANAPSPIFAWDINQWLPKACPRIALRVIRPSQKPVLRINAQKDPQRLHIIDTPCPAFNNISD